MNKLEINNVLFKNIKHIDENGLEYWLGRELQLALIIRNGESLKV